MKIDLIGYYLATGQIEKAWETAELMDDSSILEKLHYTGKIPGQDHIREQDIDAYKNIGKLKATTDQKDPFHIYKLNCKAINGEPSYVFKTSSKALELAIKMDEKSQPQGQISAMVFEHAYIDAMHSRVKGYKTITMWTYHPGMRRVLCLAVMEAEKENTEMLVLFLELFNEALAKFKGHPGYKFNPRGIMCDENGANLNAIATVLGRDFLGKTVTCQWHFRQCAQCQITSINVAE